MSRRRYISTQISLDTQVNKLATEYGDFAALLYTWMIPHAEDNCLITGDPEQLLMQVVPGRRDKTVLDVESAIEGMVALGLLRRLEGPDGKRYLQFPPASFYRYQTYIPEHKRAAILASNDATKPRQRKTAQNTEEHNSALDAAQNSASPSPSPSPSLSREVPSTSTVESVGDAKIVPHVGGAENGNCPADEGKREGDRTEGASSGSSELADEAARKQRGERAPSPEQAVMDCYNELFADLWARPLRLTPERRAKIKARLKSYSVEEICQAIRNIRASPYHCGENEGGKVYATPEFICRNDSTVDKWLKSVSVRRADATENRFGGKAPSEVKAYIESSLAAFMARKEAMTGGAGGSS